MTEDASAQPDARAELASARAGFALGLRELNLEYGKLSTRELSRRTRGAFQPSSASDWLSGKYFPSMETTVLLVCAITGQDAGGPAPAAWRERWRAVQRLEDDARPARAALARAEKSAAAVLAAAHAEARQIVTAARIDAEAVGDAAQDVLRRAHEEAGNAARDREAATREAERILAAAHLQAQEVRDQADRAGHDRAAAAETAAAETLAAAREQAGEIRGLAAADARESREVVEAAVEVLRREAEEGAARVRAEVHAAAQSVLADAEVRAVAIADRATQEAGRVLTEARRQAVGILAQAQSAARVAAPEHTDSAQAIAALGERVLPESARAARPGERERGTLKWFDAEASRGMVIPDRNPSGPRVYFTGDAVEGFQQRTPRVGQTVEFLRSAEGSLTASVISLAPGPAAAVRSAAAPVPPAPAMEVGFDPVWSDPAQPVPPATRPQGTVKWYNAEKGWGFITPDDDGADVFLHFHQIMTQGVQRVLEGQRVEFDVSQGQKGPIAENVVPL